MEQNNLGACNSSYLTTINGTNVTVQALPMTEQRAMLTQRSSGQVVYPSTPSRFLIPKVLIKCASKENKKESKTFTLRNVDSSVVTSCVTLKALIKAQLKGDVEKDFDIGYQHNNSVVSIRSADDLLEVWSNIRQGKNVTLWCDGLKTVDAVIRHKRPANATEVPDEDDDDQDVSRKKPTTAKPKKKKKNEGAEAEAVESIVEKLKDLHRESGYTPMQFRIWAEMHNGGLHPSLDEPPKTTMFARAGGGQAAKKKPSADPLTQAISQLAAAISPSITPTPSHTGRGAPLGTSPAKLIDNRTKCYKQLSELSNLKESGLLSDEEYHAEREAIMEVLKNLSA